MKSFFSLKNYKQKNKKDQESIDEKAYEHCSMNTHQ